MRSWDLTTYWERKEAPFWHLGWIPKEEASVFREAGSEAGRPSHQAVVRECLLKLPSSKEMDEGCSGGEGRPGPQGGGEGWGLWDGGGGGT